MEENKDIVIENSDEELSNKDSVCTEKGKKKGHEILKQVGIVLLLTIVIIIGALYFVSGEYLLLYDNFACSVNTFWQIITNSEELLLPEIDAYTEDAKPVIYLYPEKETSLSVLLGDVDFTATYPVYKNGWFITASPDGTLKDSSGREYNYLYWEGISGYVPSISEGFVVAKEDYVSFLEEKLAYIGLSNKEACDFISYWLPVCNKYDYTLISFQPDYGKYVDIDYSVEPDNELVVFAAFKGLDKPIDVPEQDLSVYKSFKREGFVSVEWGGVNLNK